MTEITTNTENTNLLPVPTPIDILEFTLVYKGAKILGTTSMMQDIGIPEEEIKVSRDRLVESLIRSKFLFLQTNAFGNAGTQISMVRESLYLLTLKLQGKELTDSQSNAAIMFLEINQWETRLVQFREDVLKTLDYNTAIIDTNWPFPPEGLLEFAKDY